MKKNTKSNILPKGFELSYDFLSFEVDIHAGKEKPTIVELYNDWEKYFL